MRYLLIKSKLMAAAPTDEPKRDELSTYEKLKAALEDRVKRATNDRDRQQAEAELREFLKIKR
jgi:hypothetical protein